MLASLWIVLIGVLSFLPFRYKLLLHTRGNLHFAAHCLVFAIAGLLLSQSVHSMPSRVFLLLGLLAFACTMEFAQHLLFSLRIEWRDVTADSAGVLLALFTTLARASVDPDQSVR